MNFAWDLMQTALERVFSTATGIPFVWEESIRRMPRAPVGILSLGDSHAVGRDAHRYTFRDSSISLDMYGYRELTINVQVRTKPGGSAPSSRMLAEIARLSLANPIHRDELRAAGLVFVETHPLLTLDFSRDTRKELRSSFDVVFRLMLHDGQTADETGFFDSVTLSERIS